MQAGIQHFKGKNFPEMVSVTAAASVPFPIGNIHFDNQLHISSV